MTIRAADVLRRADVIFCPRAGRAGRSNARTIIDCALAQDSGGAEQGQTEPRPLIEEFAFPMRRDRKGADAAYDAAAQRALDLVDGGATVAYVTIGDPMVYSTYAYFLDAIWRCRPGFEIETIPGVSAPMACAAILNRTIARGRERFCVLPLPQEIDELQSILRAFDSVVIMKVGRRLDELTRCLQAWGRAADAALVSHVGMSDECVVRSLEDEVSSEAGYLATVIVSPPAS